MNPKPTIMFAAALAAGVACASPVLAQMSIAEAPAAYLGPATCATKFPGSFLDAGTAACWQCPATHPNRTVFIPITVANACERPAQTLYRKASGPANPTGLIGTDCRSGWFLHWDRKCYSCGSGYVRTAEPNITSTRACARVIPAAWTTATRQGVEGCPAGSFRNGVTPYCYACPPDYTRNAVIADDLTKVNACTRISTVVQNETKAKFDGAKDSYTATRDNMGSTANSVTEWEPATTRFDSGTRLLMKIALDREIASGSGFNSINWMATGGASAVLSNSQAWGFVMTKVGDVYECRKVTSTTVGAGFSLGAGVTLEINFSKGFAEGLSESNGWETSSSIPPVAGAFGLYWDAKTGEGPTAAFTFGPGLKLEINLSEVVHTWTFTGKPLACEAMTWGIGWLAL